MPCNGNSIKPAGLDIKQRLPPTELLQKHWKQSMALCENISEESKKARRKHRSQNASLEKNQALFQCTKAAVSTKPKHLASDCQNKNWICLKY